MPFVTFPAESVAVTLSVWPPIEIGRVPVEWLTDPAAEQIEKEPSSLQQMVAGSFVPSVNEAVAAAVVAPSAGGVLIASVGAVRSTVQFRVALAALPATSVALTLSE